MFHSSGLSAALIVRISSPSADHVIEAAQKGKAQMFDLHLPLRLSNPLFSPTVSLLVLQLPDEPAELSHSTGACP